MPKDTLLLAFNRRTARLEFRGLIQSLFFDPIPSNSIPPQRHQAGLYRSGPGTGLCPRPGVFKLISTPKVYTEPKAVAGLRNGDRIFAPARKSPLLPRQRATRFGSSSENARAFLFQPPQAGRTDLRRSGVKPKQTAPALPFDAGGRPQVNWRLRRCVRRIVAISMPRIAAHKAVQRQ